MLGSRAGRIRNTPTIEHEANSDLDSSGTDDLDAIIEQFRNPEYQLPVQAIKAARRHRDEMVPRLIQLIEEATHDCRSDQPLTDNGYFFATYLLAEFRATEAWPAVLAAASLPDEKPFDLYEDAITEDFGYIFASLVGGRVDALDSIIGNPDINEFVRWQAVDAIMFLVRDGVLTRDSMNERLSKHLAKGIEDDDEFVEGLICRLDDLGAVSTLPLIESAFNKGLVDPQMVGSLDEIKQNIARDEAAFDETIAGLRRPEDMIAHLENWTAFQQSDDDDWVDSFQPEPALLESSPRHSAAPTFPDPYEEAETEFQGVATVRNRDGKVGRNELCPCRSGKKYKKCCGRR